MKVLQRDNDPVKLAIKVKKEQMQRYKAKIDSFQSQTDTGRNQSMYQRLIPGINRREAFSLVDKKSLRTRQDQKDLQNLHELNKKISLDDHKIVKSKTPQIETTFSPTNKSRARLKSAFSTTIHSPSESLHRFREKRMFD